MQDKLQEALVNFMNGGKLAGAFSLIGSAVVAKQNQKLKQGQAQPVMYEFMKPADIKTLSFIYAGIKPSMLRKLLKEQRIKNYRYSNQQWCVAVEEIPADLAAHCIEKENLTPKEKSEILQRVKWSGPKSIGELCELFGNVHPRTMRTWLRKQELPNHRLSKVHWRIKKEYLPCQVLDGVDWKLVAEGIKEITEQAENPERKPIPFLAK